MTTICNAGLKPTSIVLLKENQVSTCSTRMNFDVLPNAVDAPGDESVSYHILQSSLHLLISR